jgi:farnesol dehydrogenase
VAFARTAASSGVPAESVNGDIRDAAAVRRAAEGCEAICHTAALVSMWRPNRAEFDEVNVGGLRHVLAAAAEFHLPRIVYTSSFLALPPTGAQEPGEWNDYQRTKVAADRLAHEAAGRGAPIVTVYPGVIYGPGPLTEGNLVGRQIADHLAHRLPGVIGADRLWSFSYIDDVADGHVSALESGRVGERYLLCGENAPQMRVFEILRDLVGRPLPRRIPAWAATALALVEEGRARLTRKPPLLTLGTVEVLGRDWAFDSGLAARDLGYRSRALAAGLPETITHLAGAGAVTAKGAPDPHVADR